MPSCLLAFSGDEEFLHPVSASLPVGTSVWRECWRGCTARGCALPGGWITAKPSTTIKPTGTLISRPAVRRRLAYEEKTIKSCKKEPATKNQAGASRSRSSQGGRAEQPAFVRVPAWISTFHQ